MPGHAPLDLGGLEIPLAIGVLLGGTVAFVIAVTAIARLVEWLLDARSRVTAASRDGGEDDDAHRRRSPNATLGASARRRRRGLAGLSRTVVAAMLAGSLLFALAWWSFVLSRIGDLG